MACESRIASGMLEALRLTPGQIIEVAGVRLKPKEPKVSSPDRFIAILGGMSG